MTMPNPSDKLSENKDLGVAASSGGRSGGASPPSPQAVSAVPAPAANALVEAFEDAVREAENDCHFGTVPRFERSCDEREQARAALLSAIGDLAEALTQSRRWVLSFPVVEDTARQAMLSRIDAALSRLTPSKE